MYISVICISPFRENKTNTKKNPDRILIYSTCFLLSLGCRSRGNVIGNVNAHQQVSNERRLLPTQSLDTLNVGPEWAQGRDAVGRPRPSERDPLFIWSLKHLGLESDFAGGAPAGVLGPGLALSELQRIPELAVTPRSSPRGYASVRPRGRGHPWRTLSPACSPPLLLLVTASGELRGEEEPFRRRKPSQP